MIWFSYNGIDLGDHAFRMNLLAEVLRLLEPGGHFFFSSHNLLSYRHRFSSQHALLSKHWFRWLRQFLLFLNEARDVQSAKKSRPFAILQDRALTGKCHTYYVNPGYQLEVLKDLGFQTVAVTDEEGRVLEERRLPTEANAKWVHFLVQKPETPTRQKYTHDRRAT
jgi:hypothetical protein